MVSAPRPSSPRPAAAAGHEGVQAAADPADAVESLVEALDPALEALPAPMWDGFLVGVLLQRRPVAAAAWWAAGFAASAPARSLQSAALAPLRAALESRHAGLEAAITGRQWFDPWVFAPAPEATSADEEPEPAAVRDTVFPWVAGFAHAMASFEDLGDLGLDALDEPLALLYQHLDPDDLEDADELLALIDELEPPRDLDEAVEQLVRASLLIADVSRPAACAGAAPPGRTARPRGHGQRPQSTSATLRAVPAKPPAPGGAGARRKGRRP